jgi:hypothetical protein
LFLAEDYALLGKHDRSNEYILKTLHLLEKELVVGENTNKIVDKE